MKYIKITLKVDFEKMWLDPLAPIAFFQGGPGGARKFFACMEFWLIPGKILYLPLSVTLH